MEFLKAGKYLRILREGWSDLFELFFVPIFHRTKKATGKSLVGF